MVNKCGGFVQWLRHTAVNRSIGVQIPDPPFDQQGHNYIDVGV